MVIGEQRQASIFSVLLAVYSTKGVILRLLGPLTLADGLALVLLHRGPRAVGPAPARRRAVAEPRPPLAARAAPQPHPGRTALGPLRPRRPAAGHCKRGRDRKSFNFEHF